MNDKKITTNHRLAKPAVYETIFVTAKKYATPLKLIIVSGCISVHNKLCTYAVNQLPGGIYWEPEDPSVRKILSELDPSNDLCESLLGLNDYLTTAIPNLHQMSRSNLVEIKKNKTVHWLEDLPVAQQEQVINLAVASKQQVNEECKQEKKLRDEERRRKMIGDHRKRDALERKKNEEKRRLSELHLIATTDELEEVLCEIDKKKISQSKNESEKISIIKMQVSIRKKVLGQPIKIQYTVSKKRRPFTEILAEFLDYMAEFQLPDFVCNPLLFVGKEIRHRFQVSEDGEMDWFHGTILSYDSISKTHEILYDHEDDSCSFDIILDYLNDDIKVIC